METKKDYVNRVFNEARALNLCRTQKEFAELLSMDKSTLSGALRGYDRYLTDSFIRRLQTWEKQVLEPKRGPRPAEQPAQPDILIPAAKSRYNDEDAGRILIPRSPFDNVPRPKVINKGQKALPVETIQRLIDARPESENERTAIAAFIVSLGTMGANLADLWRATPPEGGIWHYYRSKTTRRRQDHAEVFVRVELKLDTFLKRLQIESVSPYWLPALHRWKSARVADTQVNKYLHSWCEREGVPPFNFYAARHSFATLARRLGVEKATVDEALAHIGDYRVTDIYAERNWSLAWEANRKVLDLFTWPE